MAFGGLAFIREALHPARQVVEALKAAHESDIIQRSEEHSGETSQTMSSVPNTTIEDAEGAA